MYEEGRVIKEEWRILQTIKWDEIKSLNKRLNQNGIKNPSKLPPLPPGIPLWQ
jgi:hypothetical protein